MSYFILNKPFGMLSQFTSEGGHTALKDLDFVFPKDVYPVGRLDHDSEGLLILTNDNALKNRLLDPKFKSPKTYLVQVDGAIDDLALTNLENGVSIKHNGKIHFTEKAIVRHYIGQTPEEREPPVRFRKNIPTSWITLTITEGKNRQVRKMTAAVGFPTLRLIRIKIGRLELKNLAIGEVKKLDREDMLKKVF